METVRMELRETSEGLTGAKAGSMVVLGLTALLCSCLPVCLARCTSRGTATHSYMDLLLRFGGGILLATTFLHLLPEVREGLENIPEEKKERLKGLEELLPELLMCLGFFLTYFVEELAHKCLTTAHAHSSDKDKLHADQEGEDLKGALSSEFPLRGVLMTLALSIHQVFEGLAVGLETNATHVWVLTGAVAAHKSVIAICVGAQVANATRFLAVLLIAIFSVATPLGIGLGLAISDSGSLDFSAFLLQGLAAGTLLYVVFFEVLTRPKDASLSQFFVAFIGFIVMFLLFAYISD